MFRRRIQLPIFVGFYGGSRRFLRDDQPRTPPGPEGGATVTVISGAGEAPARAVSIKVPHVLSSSRPQMAAAQFHRAGWPGSASCARSSTRCRQTGGCIHAFLFTGTRGVGKTTIARILAKSLNCETGMTLDAVRCLQCLSRDRRRPLRRPDRSRRRFAHQESTTRVSCSTTCSTHRLAVATRST